MSNDLVVRTGSIAPRRRWLGLPKRDEEVPEAPDAHEVVYRDDRGEYRRAESLSSGEKLYGRLTGWAIVDTRSRTRSVVVADAHQTREAGFAVTATVQLLVLDASEVARQGYRELDGLVDSLVHEAVLVALDDFSAPSGNEPGESIVESLQVMQQLVRRRLVGKLLDGSPAGLSLTCTSATVALDEHTRRHLEGVRSTLHTGTAIQLDGSNRMKKARLDIQLRTMWRDELSQYLTDSNFAIFETVYEDPTPARISEALRQVEERDKPRMASIFQLLQQAVDHKLVGDADDVAALHRELRKVLDTAPGPVIPSSRVNPDRLEDAAEAEVVEPEATVGAASDHGRRNSDDRDFDL